MAAESEAAVVYTFRDAHVPLLPSGAYTLTAIIHTEIDQQATEPDGAPIASESVKFEVASDRYALKPADVHSVFPPDGSRGAYARCLPQIALARDTLPWERSAGSKPVLPDAADQPPLPWLSLLLLSEQEAATYPLQTMSVKQYRQALGVASAIALETGQSDEDQIQAIELPDKLIASLIARPADLARLCHVRARSEKNTLTESVAVVLSARLPELGRNTAYLVSLENRYADASFASPQGSGTRTLIVLKSWSFTCEADTHPASESLDTLFQNLRAKPLVLPPSPDAPANPYLERGLVALPHRFRSGESSASWYRGPLMPGRPEPTAGPALPAAMADALLLYHKALAMLDTTYAAAWELGRLLTLQNRRISASLQTMRRRAIRADHRAAAAAGPAAHLPQIQYNRPAKDAAEPPPELISWIADLRRLKGVPFKYLVADERMLPPETLGFFMVDPRWVEALLDGALSIGRPSTARNPGSKYSQAEIDLLNSSSAPRLISGFLLRSAAVAGWPDLHVRGEDEHAQALEVYHWAQPAPTMLLYLFAGELRSLTIAQPATTLHLEADDSQVKTVGISQDTTGQILHLDASGAATSSELARQLIHKTQKVQIHISWK